MSNILTTENEQRLEQEIDDLRLEVDGLKEAVGALITCIVRIGVDGRFAGEVDKALLGLSSIPRIAGYPHKTRHVLRKYSELADSCEK